MKSYTSRDYKSNLEELNFLLRKKFPKDWTDFYSGNLGIAIQEFIAHDFDILSFMIDKFARESFLETAELRESIIRIANGLGYVVPVSSSSSIDVNVRLQSTQSNTTVFHKGLKVVSSEGILFETAHNFTITPGEYTPIEQIQNINPLFVCNFDPEYPSTILFDTPLPVNIRVGHYIRISKIQDFDYQINYISEDRTNITLVDDIEHNSVEEESTYLIVNRQIKLSQGESKTEEFVADGLRNQTYSLKDSFVVGGSIRVVVNGKEWKLVNNLASSIGTDTHVAVRYDEDDRPIIYFGNDFNGMIPTQNSAIVVHYKTGVASKGNIARNTINTSISAGSGINKVSAIITNPVNVGTGGADRPTIQQLKNNIKSYLITRETAVTGRDYENLANGFSVEEGGRIVASKAVLGSNEVPFEMNLVKLYVWSVGVDSLAHSPSDFLRESLKRYLDERKMIGTEVYVLKGRLKPIDMTVHLDTKIEYSKSDTSSDVRREINRLFSIDNTNPGDSLKLYKFYESIAKIQSVSKVNIESNPSFFSGELLLENDEMAVPGNIIIIQKPDSPDYLSFPNQAVSGSVVVFSWSEVSDADHYVLQISASTSFSFLYQGDVFIQQQDDVNENEDPEETDPEEEDAEVEATYEEEFTDDGYKTTKTNISIIMGHHGTYYARVIAVNSSGPSEWCYGKSIMIVAE